MVVHNWAVIVDIVVDLLCLHLISTTVLKLHDEGQGLREQELLHGLVILESHGLLNFEWYWLNLSLGDLLLRDLLGCGLTFESLNLILSWRSIINKIMVNIRTRIKLNCGISMLLNHFFDW